MIDIALLKQVSDLRRIPSGQVIIRDGDTMGNEMYILLKGTVGVYKNYGEPNEVSLAVLEPGAFFGEMSLFLNKERAATIVAADPVILLAVDRENAYHFFESQPQATYSIIQALCTRLDELNNAYTKLHGERKDTPSLAGFFPKGHKAYTLDITPGDPRLLGERSYECPICGYHFRAATVRHPLIRLMGVDSDFRPRYYDIEPLYYDIITCPLCLYSSDVQLFKDGAPIKDLNLTDENELRDLVNKGDANAIFTKLYLAMKCASFCFVSHQLPTAKYWLRLSWLYRDCGDADMELYAMREAQQAYILAFQASNLSADSTQKLQVLIGELSLKLGDIDTAKAYFNQATTLKNAELRRQAVDRLIELRQR